MSNVKQMVISLANSIHNDERLATPVLSVKLAKCLNILPHDKTIGAMSIIIDRMSDNNKTFITRGEFKSLYNKLYQNNTKFAELFKDELGEPTETVVRPGDVTKDLMKPNSPKDSEVDPYEAADPILANALNSVFDNSPLKMYSQKVASSAVEFVKNSLDCWNLCPSKLNVDAGNERFLIIKASYDTPRGVTNFYVPVETNKNNQPEISVFVGNSGSEDLNHTNIKNYIKSNAGNKLSINGDLILKTLTSSLNATKGINNAELALIKLNASKQQKSEFFYNQVVCQDVDSKPREVIKEAKSNEFSSFEDKFGSPYGTAIMTFGEAKVNIARDAINRSLIGFGYHNPQIVVSKSDDNTVYYGVSLNAGQAAFTVPMKIGKVVSEPSLMICNGSVSSFDRKNINEALISDKKDLRVAAISSVLAGSKPEHLITTIKESLAEANYARAEEALNVLASYNDQRAYAIGFGLFVNGLSPVKTAEASTKCSRIVKNSSSKYDICSHTGLPVHKVFQDKYGNCQPSYRKGMDELYEGVMFNSAKVLL